MSGVSGDAGGADEVYTRILTGEFDEDLERLALAVRNRQRERQAQQALIVASSLRPGDKVRLVGLKPLRYNGRTGTVTSVLKTWAVVELANGEQFRIPFACLQKESVA